MQLVDTPKDAVITPQSQSSSYSVSTETTSIKPSRSPKLSVSLRQETYQLMYRGIAYLKNRIAQK